MPNAHFSPKPIFSLLTVATLSLLYVALFVGLAISVHAQRIGIKPFTEDGQSPRSVFRYIASPGETITDSIVVTNGSDFDGGAFVQPNDLLYNSGGNITYVQNDVTNTEVGSWISLVEQDVEVPAGRGLRIPFSLTVPTDTPAGEYAGGITVVPSSDDSGSGGVGVKVRSGITVYVTVPGDLRVDNNISEISVINPGVDNFVQELNDRAFITPENMVVKLIAENNGNMFSQIEGVLRFTFESGETEEIPFSRVLTLQEGVREFYIQTRLPYELGTTSLTFEYNSTSYNDPDTDFSISEGSSGTTEYSFETTQDDLDAFAEARNARNAEIAEQFGTPDTGDNSFGIGGESEDGEDTSDDAATDDQDLSMLYYIIGGLGVVILILVVGFGLVILKRKREKKEPKDEGVTPPSSPTDTPTPPQV
jgi:hypothetical protein